MIYRLKIFGITIASLETESEEGDLIYLEQELPAGITGGSSHNFERRSFEDYEEGAFGFAKGKP